MPHINSDLPPPVELHAENFGARSYREILLREAADGSIRDLLSLKTADPLKLHFSDDNSLAFVRFRGDIWVFALSQSGEAAQLGLIKNPSGVSDLDCVKLYDAEYLKYEMSDHNKGRVTVFLRLDRLVEVVEKTGELWPAHYAGPIPSK